jgi:hypothetical protein
MSAVPCTRMRRDGIVKLTDRGHLFPAPLGLSGQHIRRAKEFPDPSWRATDTRSTPRPLKLTMRAPLLHVPRASALARSRRRRLRRQAQSA